MPSHFGRFRLLNDTKRIRNDGDCFIHLRVHEEDDPLTLPPGAESAYPIFSPTGETIIEVEFVEEP